MAAKILVVEDNPAFQRLLALALSEAGYEVIVANDGADGLKKAREYHPQLIILDIMLPGMDGYEVCRYMRSDPQLANLPILMLTAKAGPRDEQEGFRAGADDYLTKPVDLSELMQRIQTLLFFARAS